MNCRKLCDVLEFLQSADSSLQPEIALPPPPRPPFDIETMEPLDVPSQWGWSDEIGPPPEDWWIGGESVWAAPELDFGDGGVLVLDAGNPFPMDDLPV
ncbi:MAG: hypothetical protein IT576_18690 [Verrucomicrobiales bacterium]|nr:hypothetical protein [Verrucomicrobiales bacterium]